MVDFNTKDFEKGLPKTKRGFLSVFFVSVDDFVPIRKSFELPTIGSTGV